MRASLASLNVPLSESPGLNTLIDSCRSVFNKTNPNILITAAIAQQIHDLRKQRNAYARGNGSTGFPSVARMVIILGRFFDLLP